MIRNISLETYSLENDIWLNFEYWMRDEIEAKNENSTEDAKHPTSSCK